MVCICVLTSGSRHKGSSAPSLRNPVVDKDIASWGFCLVRVRAFSFLQCVYTVGWVTGRIFRSKSYVFITKGCLSEETEKKTYGNRVILVYLENGR